jgi:tetratricopeptide (TPR) repeat protein
VTRCPRCQRRLPPSGDCPTHGRATGVVTGDEAHGPTPPTHPVTPPPGWRLERQLATGGTAHVFAVVRDDGARAIFKTGRWRERDIHARFELEAAVLRAAGAAWTPALYDHGAIDGWPYLLMELLAGETLAAWMSRAGERGALGEILGLLDQLASGLAAIHALGIIHRDLKPENVMITPRGVRLIDFGLAKQRADLGLTQIGAVVGTVHYLAPEQVRGGGTVDHRADLYSFGVVAFEMLCGRPPFVGERRAIEYQHTVGRPPSVRETRAVPEDLDRLVTACLAKEAEARPQTAHEVRAAIARAAAAASTARGVAPRALGVRGRVALLWVEGAEPVAVVRAVGEVNGLVVRRRGDGVLAAFTGLDHDSPLTAALAAVRAITAERGSLVLHVGTALIRRSPQGKVSAYGDDVEHFERWLPPPGSVTSGLILTGAAAEVAPDAPRAMPELPGFYRPGRRERTDASDARTPAPLVGRSNLIESLAAVATQAMVDARPVHVAIAGASGAGKSRVLAAVVDQLRGAGHQVIALRGERRFTGEAPDARLADRLGGDLAAGLDHAAAHGVVIAIDDAMWLPAPTVRAIERVIARDRVKLALLSASAEPIGDRDAGHRIDVVLPALGYDDADALVRELLRPARLIPNVLIERLAIRAAGNPGVLVALAGEITRRGAVRRHVGSDEWYVAADELDTLLAAPSPAWFAVRALEDLPAELAALVRVLAVLGPRFSADEVAAVRAGDATAQLAWLVGDGLLWEAEGWYSFRDAELQDAIYDHVIDERERLHGRAFRYWLAAPGVDAIERLARLAHHGASGREAITATTCFVALARAARARGDDATAEAALDRGLGCLGQAAPRLHATTLVERARVRQARGRLDEACRDARRARQLAEDAGDLETQLDALVVEASAASANGLGDVAAAACARAAAIATVDTTVAIRTRVLGAIGATRARDGKREEAATMLHLAAALAEATGDTATLADVERVLPRDA